MNISFRGRVRRVVLNLIRRSVHFGVPVFMDGGCPGVAFSSEARLGPDQTALLMADVGINHVVGVQGTAALIFATDLPVPCLDFGSHSNCAGLVFASAGVVPAVTPTTSPLSVLPVTLAIEGSALLQAKVPPAGVPVALSSL